MDYSLNILPRYLAKLGADVHIVAPAFAPYYRREDFAITYGQFSTSGVFAPGTIEEDDGHTLVRTIARRRLTDYENAMGGR